MAKRKQIPWWLQPLPKSWWKKKPALWALLALLLLTIIAYSPTFSNDFTNWDDDLYVAENTLVTQGDYAGMFSLDYGQAILAALDSSKAAGLDTRSFVAGNYHPLTIASLAINYQMGGLNPDYYQATNILLHLLNTLLVFVVVLGWCRSIPIIAWIAAALFALHPMHVESVAWIAERKDVLYTFFFLLGLWGYHHYQKDKNAYWLALTFLFFLLSCLSKPAAVIFPVVLLLLDWWYQRPLLKARVFLEKIPFFLMSLLFGLITLTTQIDSSAYGGLQTFSIWERLQMAGYGFVQYLFRFLVPFELSAFYPYPNAIGTAYLLLFLLAVAVVAGTILLLRQYRWLAFGIGFFGINLLLVLQFVTVGSAIIAERYTYVPYIGLGLIVGYAIYHLWQGRWPALQPYRQMVAGIVMVGIFVLGGMTYARTQIWKNTEVLFTDVIEKYPNAVVAWNNRGHYYRTQSENYTGQQRQSMLQQAIQDYSQAITIDPNYHLAYTNRGKAWFDLGQYQKAIADYSKGIALRPANEVAYVNRGAAYGMLREYDKALRDFAKAAAINPNYDEIYYNRGITYQQMRQFDKAEADYKKYLQFRPDHNGIHNSLGIVYQSMGQHQKAVPHFSEAIRLGSAKQHPDVKIYHYNRSLSYRVLGQLNLARQDARKALQLGYPVPKNYLQMLGL